jgi:hypothetical protein
MGGGEMSFVVELVSQLGSMGFILWLVWRTTNHTIPRLAKSFEDSTKEARNDFKEILALERGAFLEALKSERAFFEKQIEARGREVTTVVEILKQTHGH